MRNIITNAHTTCRTILITILSLQKQKAAFQAAVQSLVTLYTVPVKEQNTLSGSFCVASHPHTQRFDLIPDIGIDHAFAGRINISTTFQHHRKAALGMA